MNYGKIPQEMQMLKQWVTVNNDKKPMQTGIEISASSTVPETWCGFTQAVISVAEGERCNIGFVFHNNGIVGIDLDHAYDEDGFLTDTAIDILSSCKSYCEKSRSGNGLHIFVKGSIPFDGANNRNGVEIYQNSRFFVMTGEQFLYDTLEENQPALDYIVEKYFSADPRNPSAKVCSYKPVYDKPTSGKIRLKPRYPVVGEGGRHSAMVSVAGQLWVQGYEPTALLQELLTVNQHYCDPPLAESEIKNIAKSIERYKR